MPPKKPRSTARWMPSRLTGPNGIASSTPTIKPTGMIKRIGKVGHGRTISSSGRDDRPWLAQWDELPGVPAPSRTRAVGRRTVRQQEGPPGCGIQRGQLAVFLDHSVLALLMLVHCLDGSVPALAQAGKGKSDSTKKQQARSAGDLEISYGTAKLPAPVAEMREAILAAVRSGKIEELRHAYELNELKPELGPRAGRRSGRALEEDLGRRRGPRGAGGAGRDPGGRLRGAAARPRSREQPHLRLALLRRGAARTSSRPPSRSSCCGWCRRRRPRRCCRPVNIPIGGWRSAPMAPGTPSASDGRK